MGICSSKAEIEALLFHLEEQTKVYALEIEKKEFELIRREFELEKKEFMITQEEEMLKVRLEYLNNITAKQNQEQIILDERKKLFDEHFEHLINNKKTTYYS